MSKIEISLNSVRDGSILQKCPEIAQDILKGNSSILNVVINLQECLTHPEPVYRGGGLQLITNVLQLLPKNLLKPEELRELSTYVCERLNDQTSVLPAALDAVFTLTLMENLPASCAKNLLSKLFDEVPCQQQTIKDRLKYMSVIRECLVRFPKEMIEMNNDLMQGFMESVDGERDPKCLVLNYKTFVELSHILPDIDVNEDTFEVFGVYFPIDFSAPVSPDRPYTRDNLARLLRSCLLAYRSFSKYLIPLVLEKLDSQFEIAKLDSLEVLLQSCETYRDPDYEPFLIEICKLLRLEILTGRDSKTCALSLRVLKTLTSRLSGETQKQLIDIVLNFCLVFLKDSTMRQQHSTVINVLCVTALASKTACETICETVLPILLDNENVRSDVLINVNILLTCIRQTAAKLPVELYEKIIQSLSQPSQSENLKTLSLATLTLLCENLDYDMRCRIYENSFLIKDENLKENYIWHLKEMAKLCEQDFIERFIPQLLMENLKDVNAKTERSLEYLLRLSFVENLTDLCSETLIKIMRDSKLYKITIRKLLQAMKVELTSMTTHDNSNSCTSKNIVDKLLKKYSILTEIEKGLSDATICESNDDDEVLQNVTELFEILVPHYLTQQQNNELHELIDTDRCTEWTRKSLAVYSGLIRNLSKCYEFKNILELCKRLTETALSDDDCYNEREILCANETLFRLLNRTSTDSKLDEILQELRTRLEDVLSSKIKPRAVVTWSWITKALLLRGSQHFTVWLQKLFTDENDPTRDSSLRTAYRILCLDDCCCPVFDGNVRLLHRQRLYHVSAGLLKNIGEQPGERVETNTGLYCHNLLVEYAPLSVLDLHAADVLSLLSESVRITEDPELSWITLFNMKKILEDGPERSVVSDLLYESIDKFLPRLMEIQIHGEHQVQRTIALAIVSSYGNCKKFLTKYIRYKQDVVACLRKCLNDPIRDVRFLAHEALETWSNIDKEP